MTKSANFSRWFGGSRAADERGDPLVMYHGTTAGLFSEFSHTSDIGFHFGTLKAARSRMQRFGAGAPDVEVVHVTPNPIDMDSLAAMRGQLGNSPADELYALLLRKLDSPRLDLRQQVEGLTPEEKAEAWDEHAMRPDSQKYWERLGRAMTGELWRVVVNGTVESSHASAREAKARLEKVRKQLSRPMPVYLSIQNPLPMPDLGVWPAQEIAHHAQLLPEEVDRVAEAGLAEEQYEALREILEAKGYDGIVYSNEVEDPGSTSFIVFRPSQIKSATRNLGLYDPRNPNIFDEPTRAADPGPRDEMAGLSP